MVPLATTEWPCLPRDDRPLDGHDSISRGCTGDRGPGLSSPPMALGRASALTHAPRLPLFAEITARTLTQERPGSCGRREKETG
jgi:hypothetical protein